MVRRLRVLQPKRLVLAYVNIGQAESYRTYWRKSWKKPTTTERGTPDFILSVDPEGWKDNFPVAYWDPRWQAIVAPGRTSVAHSESSLLAHAMADGFDGIYMDWVGGYEDPTVVQAATEAGVNPALAMIEFIRTLRTQAHQRDPSFLIVAQNAPYLLDADPTYIDAIDGIGMEDTWFGGSSSARWGEAKGGDLPNRYAEDASTAGIVNQLQRYRQAGCAVFTVDYCLKPKNARHVYTEARKRGFVPLVTQVSLAGLTTTPPPTDGGSPNPLR